jgi:carbon storage regulator CsrA
MLVLTRYIGQSIQVGPGVEVKLLSVDGRKRARVGIEAPQDVNIWRTELGEAGEAPPEMERQGRNADAKEFAVLLVEDDPIHARLISRVLTRTSAAKVRVAPSGEEAAGTLWNGHRDDGPPLRPRMILMDLRLPGMSGLDLLAQIKSDDRLRRTPVVMLSSSSQPAEIERCLDAGANAFVTKSPNYGELCTSLSRIAQFWAGECRLPDDALRCA